MKLRINSILIAVSNHGQPDRNSGLIYRVCQKPISRNKNGFNAYYQAKEVYPDGTESWYNVVITKENYLRIKYYKIYQYIK